MKLQELSNTLPSEPRTRVATGRSTGSGIDTGLEAVGRELVKGLRVIQREQLSTGEIPSYQRVTERDLRYRPSPLVSTHVCDALGYFDPRSPSVQSQALGLVPAQNRPWFIRTVAQIRQRIRAFIAWHEEPDGVWRFYGRGSGIDPDSYTTACAATTLVEGARSGLQGSWSRHADALQRFQSTQGPFYTWVSRDGRGYNTILESGRPVGFDRIVNANVLRYLAFAGDDVDDLIAYLLAEVAAADFRQGSPYHPNPACFFYALARTWRQAQFAVAAEIAATFIPHILSLQDEEGGFGDPLHAALALSALLDLGYKGPALNTAAESLLRMVLPGGGWGCQDYLLFGFGSPSLTTALCMVALARCSDLW